MSENKPISNESVVARDSWLLLILYGDGGSTWQFFIHLHETARSSYGEFGKNEGNDRLDICKLCDTEQTERS